MKAGVFDSGVGGLTVVKPLLEEKLFSEIIYFGDTARVPYGVKDRNTITRYALEAVEFFKNFDIEVLIIACNTVSAYAIEQLQKDAPFKIVGVIEAGVMALKCKVPQRKSNILILGTKATISSGKYEKFLEYEKYSNIISLAPSLFVPIAEEGLFGSVILEEAMKHYFKDISSPDVIILGCTHFPLIAKDLTNFFPNALLIHSGEAIVEFLKYNFKFSKKFEETKLKIFASDNPSNLKKIAKIWLKREI